MRMRTVTEKFTNIFNTIRRVHDAMVHTTERICRKFGKMLSKPPIFRKRWFCIRFLACGVLLLLWWRLTRESNPLPASVHTDKNLEYLRLSRSLRNYLDNIHLLIEPSSPPCAQLEHVPLVALVTSEPGHHALREAIRNTWAFHQPTFFIMGLDVTQANEQLINNYIEAKQHDDVVLYDFGDHFQNLTIKVALAMRWALERCPQAEFLLKVEDDVLVNPWTLQQVLRDNQDSKIVGSLVRNRPVVRQQGRVGYTPRWLYSADEVPEFLSGHGYLINGDSIRSILKAAYNVPMINSEDVYYTHLGYELSDDVRLQPWRPFLPSLSPPCLFWPHATVHGLRPQEMLSIWSKLQTIVKVYENNGTVCQGVFRMLRFII